MNMHRVLAFLASIVCACSIASENVQQPDVAFPIPDRYEHINDYIGIFLLSKSIEISRKLQALERYNGTQIVFLSVPSVGSDSVYEYGVKVLEKWDIGNNGEGNGVLFLVIGSAGAFIFTGPGIAGALPDTRVARIWKEIIDPYWQREEISEGAEAGIDAMIKEAYAEYTSPTFYDYMQPVVPTKLEHLLIAALILFGMGYAAVIFWLRRKKTIRVKF